MNKPNSLLILWGLGLWLAFFSVGATELWAWKLPGNNYEAAKTVELVKIMNQRRAVGHLGPLSLDDGLCEVADYEAAILAKNLSPQSKRHPNLKKSINLAIPLRRENIRNQAVGVLRIYSNLDSNELVNTMLSNSAERNELLYENYTEIGVRVKENANGQRLVVLVFSTDKIDQEKFRHKVLELVNRARLKAGLSPVVWSSEAAQAAQIRAQEIQDKLSHTRPSGSSWYTVIREMKIPSRTSGENIAAGQRDPYKVMADWLNSPGHRENILLENFNRLGVGLAVSPEGRLYWSQLFLEQLGENAAAQRVTR
jgi:uncharacterized protein YkwD